MATTGVDISASLPTSTFSCMAQNGMQFAIPRAWRSYGAIDPYAASNVNNAHSGGIKYVDVYLFPCRGQSASS